MFEARCYFCHGYAGDARTEAATQLDPPPRDLTAAPALDRGTVLDALRNGRPGTAMASFSDVMDGTEMELVAGYVAEVLALCGPAATVYHSEANGWPDHEARYGPAIPFATGEIALDTGGLDAAAREGRALFESSCISCHEGRLSKLPELEMEEEHAEEAHDEYDTPTIHDIAPVLDNPTPDESEGARLYADACAACHAADGSGQNWIGKFLDPSPPDFRSGAYAAAFDEAEFARLTLDATRGTTMPSFRSVLDERQAAQIAAYVARALVGTAAE